MGGKPSQKTFESALATQLCRMDVSRPILLEAESSKIGELLITPKLWEGMKTAPWIEVTAPLEARTDYLARAYDDILSDAVGLRQKLAPLKAHRGEALVSAWIALSESGDKQGLTRSLMQDHYDLAYAKSMKSRAPNMVARIDADGSLFAVDVGLSTGIDDDRAVEHGHPVVVVFEEDATAFVDVGTADGGGSFDAGGLTEEEEAEENGINPNVHQGDRKSVV